jgi:uncharacterized protein (TIGR00255 family)
MTGFGRAEVIGKLGKIACEVHSVNRKYLEVFVSLPRELSRYEHEIRKQVASVISRGQVNLRVLVAPSEADSESVLPSVDRLRTLQKGWGQRAHELGLDPSQIDLRFLASQCEKEEALAHVTPEDERSLHRVVEMALLALIQMKRTEGKALAQDIEERLQTIKSHASQIEPLFKATVEAYKTKLKARLFEVLGEGSDERFLREALLMSDKLDVSEELTRIDSHLAQFAQVLHTKGSGRKMEFLLQELMREVTTTGSKSADVRISHLVVDMKAELEKIREQIQNIE